MPKPLFAKLVAVAAIGFLCLLGGSVYGLSTEDRILLMLSILIGACSLIRFLLLLRDIRSGSYYVLFGTCVKREPSLFKKSQQITFKSDEGKECILRSPADFDAFQSGRCAEHNGRPESLVIMD